MDPEHFAEWYRRQGHNVIRTHSSYWFDAGPRVYQAFPFGWLIQPSAAELREMLLRHSILCARYSSPLEAPAGMVSYHVTLHNPYSLELLRSQARNAVKRGLGKCFIEQIPLERAAGEGWLLQKDALERQGRAGSMDEAHWRRVCLAAAKLDGFESWAALVDGELAAALITCRVNDTYYVPYAFSHSKFLDFYVNNALFYSVSCNLLARKGIQSIFFTVQSLDAPKSVDEFKFRMGLQAQAVRQRVVFHPLLQPFITRRTHEIVSRLIKHYPRNPGMAKVEGMIRFYLQGNLPIQQQVWPDCIAQFKPAALMTTVEEFRGNKVEPASDAHRAGSSDGKV